MLFGVPTTVICEALEVELLAHELVGAVQYAPASSAFARVPKRDQQGDVHNIEIQEASFVVDMVFTLCAASESAEALCLRACRVPEQSTKQAIQNPNPLI